MIEPNFALELEIARELRSKDDLRGITPRPDARRLKLGDIESLDGIDTALPNLEWLSVHSDRLIDVSAAAKLPKLRALELYFCEHLKSIDALNGHPTLAVVCLRGTQIERKQVPLPLRKACTWAWVHGSKLSGMAQRAAPKAKTKAKQSKKSRRTLGKLRELLKAADLDNIEQGLHLASALDPKEFDTLTRTIRYEKVFVDAASRQGWEHRLKSSAFKGDRGHYAMVGLIALAPSGTRLAGLRDGLHTLDLIGKAADSERAARLEHLAKLCLMKLEVVRFRIVGGPVELATLESLNMRECKLGAGSIEELFHAPYLKTLWLAEVRLESLHGVQRLLQLDTLAFWRTHVTSLEPLRNHPNLRRLFLNDQKLRDLDVLPTLAKLEEVGCSRSLPTEARDALLARGVTLS